MKANNFQIVNRGIGGYCDAYNIDALELRNVVVAVRFARWDNGSRKYYEIPVSVKNQAAVIAAFPGLNIIEDEPGAVLLRNSDDETAVKVGMFAAELDGELTPEPTNTDNNNNIATDNTPTTMNANETTVPEFSQLSHTAANIVLTAENDGDIYRRHVQPLIMSLVNKIKRGIKPDRKRLAQSAAMRSIIAAALAEMYCAGWMEDNTRAKAIERKEAANYLAWSYISDAEDEYSNQMAAYK